MDFHMTYSLTDLIDSSYLNPFVDFIYGKCLSKYEDFVLLVLFGLFWMGY